MSAEYAQMTIWDGPLKEEKTLWLEMIDLKERQNNLRRGLFGRYDFMKKELASLRAELDELRRIKVQRADEKVQHYDDLRAATG